MRRPQSGAHHWPLAAAVLLVAALACCWLIAGGDSTVTRVVAADDCRHPLLVTWNGRLFLAWAKGAPSPTDSGSSRHRWHLAWLEVTDPAAPSADEALELSLPTVQATGLRSRPAGCADETGVFIVYPRAIWDSQQGTNAVVEHFVPDSLATGEIRVGQERPLAVLPHSQAGVEPLVPVDASRRGRFWYRTEDVDFTWVDISRDPQSGVLWLCAVNTIFQSRQLQVTRSPDGEHWSASDRLATNACHPSIAALSGRAIVTFTDAGETSHQSLWSDDLPLSLRPRSAFAALRGALKCRSSADGGLTWEPARTVVERNVISSRCVWAPDGTIWTAYVEWLGADTALNLTSSTDGGRTWTTPVRITKGGYIDRDPAIAFHGTRVVVAFSRCDSIGGRSNIWLWRQ